MAIVIKPPGQRIAAEHHEFPDVCGIGRLVIPHEDLSCSFSDDFNLTGCMRHDKPCPFRKAGTCLPGFLDNLIRLFHGNLEEAIAQRGAALEDVIG